jgi:hypothetical protein
MNDRVYRIGSLVEAEMGLTLVEITTGSLTFEDERGGRYTRTFFLTAKCAETMGPDRSG